MLELPPAFDTDLIYYISGPMSGLPNYNYPAFDRASRLFREFGLEVITPHEILPPPGEPTPEAAWQYYMAACKIQCAKSEAIILLEGWPRSRGSRQELIWILGDEGCPVYYLDLITEVLTDMNRGGL